MHCEERHLWAAMERHGSSSIAFWWVIWAAAALVIRLLSEGILEAGDGVLHYQIARYSWAHPELLLDHWGKPLFTLLASPFAQLGHWGMTLFNALCFVATAWAADRMLRETAPWSRWLFAPTLLLVPVYGTMVLEGMTEVLFGLLATLVVLSCYHGRYRTAALVASLMPFARPEYIVFVPLLVGWLAFQRQWKALPLLAVGHVLYAVVGAIAWGEPFWAFTRDPYTGAEAIYGSGALTHFVQRPDLVYGIPLVVLIGASLLVLPMLHPMDAGLVGRRRVLVLLALLPAVAILVVHSLLWWQGAKGSLGLLRVLATSAPLLVLFALWVLARAWHLLSGGRWAAQVVGTVLSVVYVVFAAQALFAAQPLPVQAGAYQRFLDRVGDRVKDLAEHHQRVVYFHPYVAYRAGLDPFDPQRAWKSMPDDGLQPGDLLVWDAHFGPNEAGVPLERLLQDTTLRLIELLVPDERMEVLGGHAFEVFLFERFDGRRTVEEKVLFQQGLSGSLPFRHRKDTLVCAGDGWCFGANEFPFEVNDLPVDVPGMLYAELLITGSITWDGERKDATNLVFTEDAAHGQLSYWSNTLEEGPFSIRMRIPPRNGAVRNKLYVWNLSGTGFKLRDLQLGLAVHRAVQ
jgi:hypothetical protein